MKLKSLSVPNIDLGEKVGNVDKIYHVFAI